jgi:hypothetical protein
VCDDGLTQYAIGRRAASGDTVFQRTVTSGSSAHVIVVADLNAVFYEVRAVATQLLTTGSRTDGIRINWESAPSEAYEVTCILFGGSGNLAFAGSGQATSSPFTWSGAPFEADAYFFAGLDSAFGANVDRIELSFGFAANRQPIEQGSIGHNFPDQLTTTNAFGIASNTAAVVFPSATGSLREMELTDITPNGFVANSTASPNFLLLGIKLALGEARVTSHDLTTTSGQKTFTTGVRPEFVMTMANLSSGYDIITQTDLSSSFGMSAFTSRRESSLSVSSEDGIDLTAIGASTNCQSYSDSTALSLLDHEGNLCQSATLYSLDTAGFTLDFSTATTAGKMIALSIEKPTLP